MHWLYRAPGQLLYPELNHTRLHCIRLGLKMLTEHRRASHRDEIGVPPLLSWAGTDGLRNQCPVKLLPG